MIDINLFSWLLASATPLAIGYVYYHPRVFASAWPETLDKPRTRKQQAILISVGFLVSVLLSFFLVMFNNDGINQEGDFDNFAHGAWHGFFITVTVVTPVVVLGGLWSGMKAKHILIHLLYWGLCLTLMGGIVDALNHWPNIPMPEGGI